MRIVIDLPGERVSLEDPDEFTRFSVALEGRGDPAGVVAASGIGRLHDDGEHLVVDPAAIRALAGPAADDAWDEGFSGMCAYAAGRGWVEAGGGLLAHIERRDAEG